MSTPDKEQFVSRVAESVVEVIAAAAVLPVRLKLGKKDVKATGKVIRKETKKLRKVAKQETESDASKTKSGGRDKKKKKGK